MKKLTTLLLLALLLFALAGCTGKQTNDPNQDSGTVSDNITPGNDTSSPDATPTPIPPTPTPEGNYVGFSLDSGFYEKSQEITLTCNVEGALIYYTLDGSTPGKTSTLYQNPINVSRKLYTQNVLAAQTGISVDNNYIPDYAVDKATVIRAIAYLPDGTTTPVAHATYFIGLDREKYGNVPIVSLITDFDNLYDYETGIYVLGKVHDDWIAEDPSRASLDGWQQTGNYSMRGREWERPISVELITSDGTAGFKQNMGVRIMGGASRNHPQKSLKLYAREEYGAKNLKYELIPGNMRSDETGVVDKYKTFVLRIGGNDADFARVRDPFLQTLAMDARFETQQSTPCIAFLNGEYWGVYAITEDYSDNYFENNYGIDNKNIVLVKRGEIEEGEEEDISLFRDMYLFITQNDMSDPEFYNAACELVDMGSFIDYFAFQLYIYNKDSIFENNNWRLWRVRSTDMATPWSDGKWRFAAYDNDFSTGIYDGSDSATYDNISSIIAPSSVSERKNNIEHYVPVELLRSLLNSETFKNELVLALCDMRNIYFEPKHATQVLNEMAAPYLQLMPESFKRFGPDWVAAYDPAGHIESRVLELRNFITKRYTAMPNLLKKAFDLDVVKKLNLTTNDLTLGTIQVNGRQPDFSFSFSGMYFPENTITLTAVPAEGCRFVRWEVTNGELADTTSETIQFTMDSAMTINAIFEKQ